VNADESVRLARRMIRDVEQRGRTPRSVMSQFFMTVRPMHEAYIEPQRALGRSRPAMPVRRRPRTRRAERRAIARALI
jgi:hypothetical protein